MSEKSIVDSLISLAPIIAGASVAAAMQAREPSEKSTARKVVDFGIDATIGASSAYFLAPATANFFGQTTPEAVGAIGFLFGLVGVQLTRQFIKIAPAWLSKKAGVSE